MVDGSQGGKPMNNLKLAPRQPTAAKPTVPPAAAALTAMRSTVSQLEPRKHLEDIFEPLPKPAPAPLAKRPPAFAPMQRPKESLASSLPPVAELRKVAAAQRPQTPASLEAPGKAAAEVTKQTRLPIPVAAPTPVRHAPAKTAAPMRAAPASKAAEAVSAPANDSQGASPAKLNENFGLFVQALAETARYRHIGLGELVTLFFEPLQRDRVAIALSGPSEEEARNGKPSAFLIWASVSPQVDEKIREQISAGVFPLRLKPEDWTSGTNHWIIDVVAGTQAIRSAALTSFVQTRRLGEIRLHPIIHRLVDAQHLARVGINPKLEEDRKTA
jgi:hemolysin-activating ACP:hemolysin acyltransferase